MAHQYRAQLNPAIRAAIDANARNKIVFNLNAADAKDMAAMAPELAPADFMGLGRYQIYASLQNNGRSTGWISGKTSPASIATRLPVELKVRSMNLYGQNPVELDTYFADTNFTDSTGSEPFTPTNIGRKKIA
jgi:hypothetical protein